MDFVNFLGHEFEKLDRFNRISYIRSQVSCFNPTLPREFFLKKLFIVVIGALFFILL